MEEKIFFDAHLHTFSFGAARRCCSPNEKGPDGPSPRSPFAGDPPPVSRIVRSIAWAKDGSKQSRGLPPRGRDLA